MINLNNLKTINQTEAHGKMSNRYGFVPTSRVIDQLSNQGWLPVSAKESGVRKVSSQGYQRHVLRFRHADNLQNGIVLHEVFPEIVLVNDHMGTSAFKLFSGLFRRVCANGLTVGDTFESFSIKHIGYTNSKVSDAVNQLSPNAVRVLDCVDSWRVKTLSRDQQLAFAKAAIELKFDGDKYAVEPRDLIRPRRHAYINTDLFTTMNVIQENLIRGGVTQRRTDGSRIRSRGVKNIKEDIRINQALWTLTEEMSRLIA